jgi:hypothetical protein
MTKANFRDTVIKSQRLKLGEYENMQVYKTIILYHIALK